ncbi:MAG: hypothetical protein MI757_00355, partial [Pirellulales bacterium]|nr:hypothetical protein [Pirellulales bacterium]
MLLRRFSRSAVYVLLIAISTLAISAGCSGNSTGAADSEDATGSGTRRITREMLGKSLVAGRQFLLLNQRNAGNFNYEYDFLAKKLSRGDSQVRQAGATWGIATIHREHPTDLTHAALAHAIQFFSDHSVLTDDGRRYIAYPGEPRGRTGTVALVSLALVEFLQTLPEGAERDATAKLLDEYMAFLLSLRYDEGPHKGQFSSGYDIDTGDGASKPSPYFDGESLLAMAKACRYAGMSDLKDKIIDSADVMHHVFVTEARKADPDSDLTKGFYQWGSMAFYEIHTAGWVSTDRYARWAIELAYWMIDEHRTLKRTKNTSYAYEGMISAWELARLIGDRRALDKIGSVIDEGLYKLTSWQVGGPNETRFLRDNPTKDLLAVGGIMNSKSDPVLRIDVTQHQMHAVVLARRFVYKAKDGRNTLPDISTGPTRRLLWTELAPPLAMTPKDAEQALRATWDALQLDVSKKLDLPKALALDEGLRIVFLSVGSAKRPASVALGHGRGFSEALTNALTAVRHLVPNHDDRKLVRLDV